MADSDSNVHGAPEPRSGAKRAAVGVARPLVGYFDRRFQDLHDHLDRLPPPPDPTARLDEVVALMRQTREDVAGDADTIAELAFTLERFSDLFTARMEEIVETMFTALGPGGASIDAHVVELPFAYAAADALPAGAGVATFGGDDGPLPLALASLGLRVTAFAAGLPAGHPNLTVVEQPVDQWSGPAEPLDAIFALSAVAGLGLERDEPVDDLDRQVVDRFRKWLRPEGQIVLTVPFGEWSVGRRSRTYDEGHLAELLTDWRIEARRTVERIDDHVWRVVEPDDTPSRAGMALVRATPRP